jgi:hypothetical protein
VVLSAIISLLALPEVKPGFWVLPQELGRKPQRAARQICSALFVCLPAEQVVLYYPFRTGFAKELSTIAIFLIEALVCSKTTRRMRRQTNKRTVLFCRDNSIDNPYLLLVNKS